MDAEQQARMQAGRRKAAANRKKRGNSYPTPIKAIRDKCLDCSGTAKVVKYCTCDGVNSTKCPLWPFRFGLRPGSAATMYGPELLDPKLMPAANTPLDDLPK